MSGYGNYYQQGSGGGGAGYGGYGAGNFASGGYGGSFGAGGGAFGGQTPYGSGAAGANFGAPGTGTYGYGGVTGGSPYGPMGNCAYPAGNYGQSGYGYASRGTTGYMGSGGGGYRNSTGGGSGGGGSGISQERQQRSVFVGNIPYKATESELIQIFSQAGSVVAFRLVSDRDTGRPKGFGFCEYADPASAATALELLNGTELHGRPLRVGSSK